MAMSSSSLLQLRLAFSLSFAFSFSAVTLSTSSTPLRIPSFLAFKRTSSFGHLDADASPSPARALARDLLSLLGAPEDAARVDAEKACELRSCLRFLVPFDPPRGTSSIGHRKLAGDVRGRADELVWWPPEPVMELARLAVDSDGDPAVIEMALDPTSFPVPDVEGSKNDKCQLTRTPYAYRFTNKELNSYFAFLFELIAARAPSMGLNVSLSRYDLFHGHIFLAAGTGRLGILFHAKEYPCYDKELFPLHMGYCQTGSNVIYDDSINLRNILWLAPIPSNVTKAWVAPGVLLILDAHPNGIIYKKLVPEYVDYVRTIYEDDFGDVVADINYLHIKNVISGDKIFIC